ncbi:MAG TPA: hypothetical protein VEZ91_09950 [Kurthia gibsonii]|nr:hypothetical protein [Kurthia gibsonii]
MKQHVLIGFFINGEGKVNHFAVVSDRICIKAADRMKEELESFTGEAWERVITRDEPYTGGAFQKAKLRAVAACVELKNVTKGIDFLIVE